MSVENLSCEFHLFAIAKRYKKHLPNYYNFEPNCYNPEYYGTRCENVNNCKLKELTNENNKI